MVTDLKVGHDKKEKGRNKKERKPSFLP